MWKCQDLFFWQRQLTNTIYMFPFFLCVLCGLQEEANPIDISLKKNFLLSLPPPRREVSISLFDKGIGKRYYRSRNNGPFARSGRGYGWLWWLTNLRPQRFFLAGCPWSGR
jgi:hypothetical protein